MAVETDKYLVDDVELLRNPDAEVRASGTHRFSHDGEDYVIDLTDVNAAKLAKALAPWKKAGRRVRPTRRRTGRQRVNTEEIRQWARKRGYDVKDRGRVPEKIVIEYRESAGAVS